MRKGLVGLLFIAIIGVIGCGRDLEITAQEIYPMVTRIVGQGVYSSVAIDEQGMPHVAIYRDDDRTLYYATLSTATGEWIIETVDGQPDAGRYNDIAIDSNGTIWIAYYVQRGTQRYVRVVYRERGDMDWKETPKVQATGGYGQWLSMAIDSNDYPNLSYIDNGQNLLYAYYDGNEWHAYAVDLGQSPGCYHVCRLTSTTSIAINSQDEPVITYYDGANGNVKFVKLVGVKTTPNPYFVMELIQTSRVEGEGLRLYGPSPRTVIDPATGESVTKFVYTAELKHPADGEKANTVLYADGVAQPAEIYGFLGGTSFKQIWIDATQIDPNATYTIDYNRGDLTLFTDEGYYNDIFVQKGNPDIYHVCYFNKDTEDLYYAWKRDDENLWHWEGVDISLNIVGAYCKVVYDMEQGGPAIVYFDGTLNNLKVAFKVQGQWRTYIADSAGTRGEYVSLGYSEILQRWGITYYNRLTGEILFGSYFSLQ